MIWNRTGTNGVIIKVGIQGPEGAPYGFTGIVIHVVSVPFSYDTVSGDVATLPAGSVIIEKEVEVVTIFDGTTPQITIGTDADHAAFLPGDSAYLKMMAQYSDPAKNRLDSETTVRYFLTLIGATQGNGFITLKYIK